MGAIQGFITSILLFRFRPHKSANTLLGWLTLLISLACLNIYFLEAVVLSGTFWIILGAILPLVVIMPLGPLAYFYVKALLYPEFELSKKNRPHFYSTLIDLVPYVSATIFIVGSNIGFFTPEHLRQWGSFIDSYHVYADIPRWLSLCIYIGFAYKMIAGYAVSKKQKTVVGWARQFTLGFLIFLVIWLVYLVPYVIPSLSNKLLDSVGWYPIYIPLIILIYWLGINGAVISFRTYGKTPNSPDLSPADIKNTIKALEEAMQEDKLYLNPSVKLNDIVKHTEIPQKTISFVLNQHMGKTFNEFINGYRVEEFKSRLLNDTSKKLTITGLAFECGFNSQATFQRTFKAVTQISPKEFQQQHLKK